MATEDDDKQPVAGEATSSDEPASSKKKVGTLLGLGDDAVKASSVVEALENAASAAAASEDADPDDDEETKVRLPPSAESPAAAPAPAVEGGDARKFKGTMLGLGEEPKAAAEPPKPEASPPPAAEREDSRKFKGTMIGLGEGKPEGSSAAPPKAESSSPPADAPAKKFGGTMLGLGDAGEKDASPAPKKARASELGTAKTEQAPAREEKPAVVSKTLVMETSQPASEKRAAPKKAPVPPADFKGNTLPLPVDSPVPREARSKARPAEQAAEVAPPAADKPSGSVAPWLGLAAVVGVAVIWFASRMSEEETPAPAATPTTESAPAAANDPVEPPKPEPAAAVAEPVVRPVDPEPAPPSSAEAPQPEPEEPKVEKKAEAAPKPKPAAERAPKPKPVREPPPPAPAPVERSTSDDSQSLSPSQAARVAVGKDTMLMRCRHQPDPAGTADAVVTFAPSGQVTAVRVLGQYAATHTAACIENRIKQATMAPFSGESVTVRVPIELR